MNIYLQQIEQLLNLQKVDDEIHCVKQELKKAPLELSSLSERYEVAKGKHLKVEEKITHIQEQQKRISTEIEEDVARIKKSKSKLMQVANQREYHAMMREMDNMEKTNRLREEEKVLLAEELQTQEAALAEIDKDYLSLKAELEVRSEGLQERMESAQGKLDQLEYTRASTKKEVDEHVSKRYEFIHKRLEHPVIVSVDAGICSGCNISIPPQSFIELQRGQQILSCPNCQRLIFWCKDFKEPEVEAAPVEPPKPEIKIFNENA